MNFDGNFYSRLASWVGSGIADANVADNITLTNITQVTNRAFSDISGRNTSLLTWDSNSVLDYNHLGTVTPNLTLPTLTGQSGKFLTTDGSTLS